MNASPTKRAERVVAAKEVRDGKPTLPDSSRRQRRQGDGKPRNPGPWRRPRAWGHGKSRRDSDPLAGAAMKRRQEEAAADRHQAAAGEQRQTEGLQRSGWCLQRQTWCLQRQTEGLQRSGWCLQKQTWCLQRQTKDLQRSSWCLHRCSWYLQRSGWCLQRQTWCLRRQTKGLQRSSLPVLPSEQEAGATAVGAEATRPVESAEVLTSPQSRAGMPAGVREEPREPQGAAPSPPRKRCNAAGVDSWRGQLSRRNPGLLKEFSGLPPATKLDLVRERSLCSRCLSLCDPKGERMHKRCRLKSRIENELCQRQHKCRQTHHRLLHVDAEGEKSPQTARLAKPAEPPDRPGRSPTHSQAKAS
jgi:hypothetical protein